jgi:hypothetical protein
MGQPSEAKKIVRQRFKRFYEDRNFSLSELMAGVTIACFVIGLWAAYGLSVLTGTLLGVALALGIGSLASRVTRPRKTPFLGALLGLVVAHVGVIFMYYAAPRTNIAEWSVVEYLMQSLIACIAGAIAATSRSANPFISSVLGCACGGATAVIVTSLILVIGRLSELLSYPMQFLEVAGVFLLTIGGLGLALGGVTGLLTGLFRLWHHLRLSSRRAVNEGNS